MKNPWRHINKCLLCGAKLIFEESKQADSRFAGVKSCRNQHNPFVIEAKVIDRHWDIRIYFPNSRQGHIYG